MTTLGLCIANPRRSPARATGLAATLLLGVAIWAALGLPGCGAAGSAGAIGVSAPRAPERSASGLSSEDAEAVAESVRVPSDFRSKLTRLGDRFLSMGHGEQFDAVLWANESGRTLRSGVDAGADALFVEEAIAHDEEGDHALGLLVMEATPSGWRYDAVQPDGGPAPRPAVARCDRCHSGAGRRALFFAESGP